MATNERCIEALLEAADKFGESPTKAQYDALGVTPASATIIRVFGSWNAAKDAADLPTNPSTGTRTFPKPVDVALPEGSDWESLTADQRWHYRNVEENGRRTRLRRSKLRAWVYEEKRTRGCARCDESDPACLDFHHVDGNDKELSISRMVTHGYSTIRLREEIEKCLVLCSNCHRKEHYEVPDLVDDPTE